MVRLAGKVREWKRYLYATARVRSDAVKPLETRDSR
jgi:hypothetical protein